MAGQPLGKIAASVRSLVAVIVTRCRRRDTGRVCLCICPALAPSVVRMPLTVVTAAPVGVPAAATAAVSGWRAGAVLEQANVELTKVVEDRDRDLAAARARQP